MHYTIYLMNKTVCCKEQKANNMKKFLYTLIVGILMLNCLSGYSQDESGNPPEEIIKYYFVELITNPDREKLPQVEVDSIQRAHMANIGRMAKEGQLMLAGPFENGGGIFILKAESLEEAESIAALDPAIKAGRLLTEIRPWYTARGVFTAETTNN